LAGGYGFGTYTGTARQVSGFAPYLEDSCEIEGEYSFADAIQAWKERMLRGLHTLTYEDIEELVEEFRNFVTRDYATEDEKRQIAELVLLFERALREMAENMNSEKLIITQDEAQARERDDVVRFTHSRILSALMPPPAEGARHTHYHAKHVSGRYESSVTSE